MSQGLRILVVDDDARLLRTVQRMLTQAKHDVVTVADGAEALRVGTGDSFDVALVDFEMPDQNGLDVLRSMRAQSPQCVRILMSGHLSLPRVVEAINAGDVARVLEKPFQTQELLDLIDDAVDAREQLEAMLLGGQSWSRRQQERMLREWFGGSFAQLALQPIVDVQSLEPVAFEALLRSSHPVLKTPVDVLRVAENLELLHDVADCVCLMAADWIRRLRDGLRLFINLHPKELGNGERLLASVEPVRKYAEHIVFEVTERSDVYQLQGWEEALQGLRSLGFAIAVDDLGSGYGSLGLLAQVKPEFIKIDMSIVRDVDEHAHKRHLIAMLADFASTTGSTLIAEGVEREGEADTLRACRVHLLQGYHLGRPSGDLPPGCER